MAAGVAGSHFTLHILEEPIGKVILIVGAPRRFHAVLPAVGAVVFHHVFLRITAERGPTRVANPDSFFRMKTHDPNPLLRMAKNLNCLCDAGRASNGA